MAGWMERRDKAAAIALAAALAIIAVSILVGGVSLRQVAGTVIVVPSLVMAAYYLIDREVYDRMYGFGLFSVIALIGLWVYGASLRVVAAAIILLVAALVAAGALSKKTVSPG